jgi:hypothetical protein
MGFNRLLHFVNVVVVRKTNTRKGVVAKDFCEERKAYFADSFSSLKLDRRPNFAKVSK